jgi:nitrate/TMAO reductase-like tetraheme cytochrome c subunit
MSNRSPAPSKKRFPWILGVVIGLVLILAISAGGFAFAASQESNDAFCGSCHSQPEATFLQRSSTSAVDLASFHSQQKKDATRCIDCHSGQGLLGRLSAELMGAYNAVKWYSGTAVQPAPLTFPIKDENCLKCHHIVTLRDFTPQEKVTVPGIRAGRRGEGGMNHWHEQLAKWQKTDPNAGGCVTCHPGHATNVDVKNGMLNNQVLQAACDDCHKVLRKGDD